MYPGQMVTMVNFVCLIAIRGEEFRAGKCLCTSLLNVGASNQITKSCHRISIESTLMDTGADVDNYS